MKLGYITNGFAHHAPLEAVGVLAEIGYRAVGLTIDHGLLAPGGPDGERMTNELRRLADERGLTYVVETGARFLLDPWTKHEPTLVSVDPGRRAERVAFYDHAIEVAGALDARCVSLWSGVARDGAPREEAVERLVGGMRRVLDRAAERGATIAFEPEPGMVVATLADYDDLKRRLGDAGAATEALRLTVDVGHLHCLGETPIAERLAERVGELANVHIEDMRAGVHEHLMFGDGEIDFPPVVAALDEAGYDGPVCVELSRHSHEAPAAARRAFAFLAPMIEGPLSEGDGG